MRKSTHTPEYERLKGHLVSLRVSAGLSQRALAERLRVPRSWVAKIESGERRLDLIEFLWICEAVAVDPGDTLASFLSSVTPTRDSQRATRRRGAP